MTDLEDLRLFAKVAEHQSFVRAAQELRLQPSLLSRRVARLEATLGVRLLQRTTRNVSLTEEGRRCFQDIQRGLNILNQAVDGIHALHEAPQGKVRISSPVDMGQYLIENVLPGFFKAYPSIEIEWDLFAEDRNPIEYGLDLVIRAFRPTEKSLISRKLGSLRFQSFISSGFKHSLKQRPTLKELEALPWVLFSPELFETVRPTLHFSMQGKIYEIHPKKIPFRANNLTAVRHAIVQGLGIGLLPTSVSSPEVKAGRLIPCLTQLLWEPEIEIYAAYPSRQYITSKVRVLMDWLATHFPLSYN